MSYDFQQKQKNTLWVGMIILSILLITSLVIYPPITPERIALNFMVAFKNVDTDACARYAHEEAIEPIGLLLGTFSFNETIGAASATPQWVDGSTSFLRETAYASCVDDNSMNKTCTICCDTQGFDYTVNLRKDRNGYWGVTLNIPKEETVF